MHIKKNYFHKRDIKFCTTFFLDMASITFWIKEQNTITLVISLTQNSNIVVPTIPRIKPHI